MKSTIILALLGVIASVYGEEVTCRDQSWVLVEGRKDGGDLCFKTFIFDKQKDYKEARKQCTDNYGYPAAMVGDEDEQAILESVRRVANDLGQFTKPDEIYLGADIVKNLPQDSFVFKWEFGNQTIAYEDKRWFKPKGAEKGQPNVYVEGKTQDCLAFHPSDSNDTIRFHDTMCKCPSSTSPGCDTHTRVGITCVTRPAILVKDNWKKQECENGKYCDKILAIMKSWFTVVRATDSLESRGLLEIYYANNAAYTNEVTKDGAVTVNQQNKPMSILFLDHFVTELQDNPDTIKVTPKSVSQYVDNNSFLAVFEFKGGDDFAAELGTTFNENLKIISQTFKVTRGK